MSTSPFSLTSCCYFPCSLDTDQTRVQPENYSRQTPQDRCTRGLSSLTSQAPTAALKIRSFKLFLALLWSWPNSTHKQCLATLFLEVNTGQGPFPIQLWMWLPVLRGRSLSVWTREELLACRDMTPQTFTYLSLRINQQRKKPEVLMYI